MCLEAAQYDDEVLRSERVVPHVVSVDEDGVRVFQEFGFVGLVDRVLDVFWHSGQGIPLRN